MKELLNDNGGMQLNMRSLYRMKEIWLEELRYEMNLLDRDQKRTKQRKNNALFEADKAKIYKEINKKEYTRQVPPVENLWLFRAGIWEGNIEIKP